MIEESNRPNAHVLLSGSGKGASCGQLIQVLTIKAWAATTVHGGQSPVNTGHPVNIRPGQGCQNEHMHIHWAPTSMSEVKMNTYTYTGNPQASVTSKISTYMYTGYP